MKPPPPIPPIHHPAIRREVRLSTLTLGNPTRFAKPLFLILLFLPLAALAAAEPVSADDFGSPIFAAGLLVIFAAYLVFIGIVILMALTGP